MALLGVFWVFFLKTMCFNHDIGTIKESNKPEYVRSSGSPNLPEVLGVNQFLEIPLGHLNKIFNQLKNPSHFLG
jgi:hypothetical protein